MQITRLVELSLYYKVQSALSRSRNKEKPKSANFTTYNLKYNSIQTNYPFIVYINGTEVDPTEYTVNYVEGQIVLNAQLLSSDVVEVSYTYCPINVYDESKNPTMDDFEYPAIAILEIERDHEGIELGSNKKKKKPTWVFEVWSERGGERNDVTDMIVEMFEEGSISIIDYNISFPTNADGSKNDNFNEEYQTIGYLSCDSINYSKGGSLDIGDKPKYLSEIIVDLTIDT